MAHTAGQYVLLNLHTKPVMMSFGAPIPVGGSITVDRLTEDTFKVQDRKLIRIRYFGPVPDFNGRAVLNNETYQNILRAERMLEMADMMSVNPAPAPIPVVVPDVSHHVIVETDPTLELIPDLALIFENKLV